MLTWGRDRLAALAVSVVAVSVALALFLGMSGGNDDATAPTSNPAPGASSKPEPESSGPKLPADVLDLVNWKLTLPTASTPDGPDEIEQPELATYSDDRFFRVGPDDSGVVFTAPTDGATTSGSDYPRTELREMTAGGSRKASWSNESGEHVMTVTQAITEVPPEKPDVVAGQIHDAKDDVVMVRLEGKRLFVEGGEGKELGDLDSDYVLGTTFTVRIAATPAGIKITYNDTKSVDFDKVGSGYYFKAGCYTQANRSTDAEPGAQGEVVIEDLSVSHRP